MPAWLEVTLVIIGYLLIGAVVSGVGLRLLAGGPLNDDDAPMVVIVALCWPIFIAISPLLALIFGLSWLVVHLPPLVRKRAQR